MKKTFFRILLAFAIILFAILLMQPLEILLNKNIAILAPKGIIALRQRNLLFVIQGLMFLVVIPVFIFAFVFVWKYREKHPQSKYTPDWDNSHLAEALWWGISFLVVVVISVLTWVLTVQLDPFKPLDSDKKSLKIQVVALEWKWLFIYPEQQMATVNFFQFPVNTPIEFEITADAPMNSFWIPQLGGQIYAMPNMRTKLHLMADAVGDYRGSSANLSGKGFAAMHFVARASTEQEFQAWVEESKQSAQVLDWKAYCQLAEPSENNQVTLFKLNQQNLFDQILMQHMGPEMIEKMAG